MLPRSGYFYLLTKLPIVLLTIGTCCLGYPSHMSAQETNTSAEETTPSTPNLLQATATEKEGLFYLWSVLTKETVRDNFGHYVANGHYAVELLLNNQYKQKLIITGVGFRVRQPDREYLIAATDPQTIKGILTKKDLVGRNARFKNIVKATGLLFTGANGFFKNTGSAATYNRSINMFNDPFQKGLDLVSPNTIIKYLETLNQDIFKTGLVLAEGSMGYLRVFVDKNNVFPPSVLQKLPDDRRRQLHDPTEPLEVQRILNRVVLQGQKVQDVTSATFELEDPAR